MRGLLLLRHRHFSLLWVAGLVSLTGDWLLGVALPIYVFKLTGSPAATSAVVAVSVGSALVAGAVAGVFVDRWDRRRVLVVANLLQVGAVLPLLAVDSPSRIWIVLMVACAESTLGQFVAPAEHALLPSIVDEPDLGAANSLSTLNSNIARLVGPALGAIVATTLGLRGAAILDAASFAAAAGLVALIGGSHRAAASSAKAREAAAVEAPAGAARLLVPGDKATGDRVGSGARRGAVRLPRADRVSRLASWWFELTEGVRAIRGSRVLNGLLVVVAVTAVGEGIMGSLFVVFAARGVAGGAHVIGWLMSAQAVGGILGGLLAAALAGRLRPIPTVVGAFAFFGVVDTVIFNLPRVTPALAPQLVLFALVGIPGAVGLAAAMTLLQTEVGDALRGRVFAAFTVAQAAAALLGAGVAAGLTERFGVFVVLTAQGVGYIVAALAFAVIVRRPPRREARVVVRLPVDGAITGMHALQRRFNG